MSRSFPFSSVSACDSEKIVSSTSYDCHRKPGKNDGNLCGVFPASNILSLNVDKWRHRSSNYWVAEDRKAGFIMFLGCRKAVRGVSLRNTQNAEHQDRSTRKFRLLGSSTQNGPWHELLVANLEDSRQQKPPPVQKLMFAKSSVVSFIKVELLEYYGPIGGGLQYFAIEGPESTTTTSKQQL